MDLYPTRSFPSWWENYPVSGLLKKVKPSATAVRYVMVLSREKENSDSDHDQTSGTRDERSGAPELLGQNEHCQGSHPRDVHHAHDEQHGHQRPAAAEAIGAVPNSHLKSSSRAIPPVAQEKSKRTLTLPQARAFCRRQLIDTGGYQNCTGETRACHHHIRRQPHTLVQSPLRECRDGAESHPHYDITQTE